MGSLFLFGDTAPEKMSDIGRDGIDFPLVTVQRQCKELSLVQPEVLVEAALQFARLAVEFRCPDRVLPDLTRQSRGAALCIIGVTLQFARGSRRNGQGAVRKGDGIAGILPALVFQASRIVPFILDITITITVAILALFGMRREYAAGERDWSEIVQWGMLPVVFYLPLVLLIGLCAALVVGLVGIHLRSGLGGPHDPSIRSPARAHSDPIVSSSPRRDSEE